MLWVRAASVVERIIEHSSTVMKMLRSGDNSDQIHRFTEARIDFLDR